MFTKCPNCAAVYSLSTADLSAAGGYVRCGSCDTTFNALSDLTEAPPFMGQPQPAPVPAPAPEKPTPESDFTETIADDGPEATAAFKDALQDPAGTRTRTGVRGQGR